jgi:hypothetical protein
MERCRRLMDDLSLVLNVSAAGHRCLRDKSVGRDARRNGRPYCSTHGIVCQEIPVILPGLPDDAQEEPSSRPHSKGRTRPTIQFWAKSATGITSFDIAQNVRVHWGFAGQLRGGFSMGLPNLDQLSPPLVPATF